MERNIALQANEALESCIRLSSRKRDYTLSELFKIIDNLSYFGLILPEKYKSQYMKILHRILNTPINS